MLAEGLSAQPLAAGFCWIALGSEGRYEQTLYTDQDNGIIFDVPDGDGRPGARAAPAFCAADQRGAGRLRLPPVQGQHHGVQPAVVPVPGGVEGPSRLDPAWRWPVAAQRYASSSISARCSAGRLVEELREWLIARVQYRLFLHMMAVNALGNRPPLGLVRDFVRGRRHPRPEAQRRVALRRCRALDGAGAGSDETCTIAAAGDRQALEPEEPEVEGWIEAFLFIQLLRLRSQDEKLQRGEEWTTRSTPTA